MTDDPELLERLQARVGRPAGVPVVARDEVNLPMIRHWCGAMGDTNPVYVDDSAAAGSRHGTLVAPAAMLQVWCMDKSAPYDDDVSAVLGELTDAGFTSVVATSYEQEYLRELHLGDILTEDRALESVSPMKHSKLGDGHFVTMLNTYRDQNDEVVGTSRMTVLRFAPVERPAASRRPKPPVNRDTQFFWDGVAHGELLIQSCSDCAQLRHPPAPMCPACGSLEWDTTVSTGRGTVHSYVVHHHPPLPGFDMPVTVVLADLEEGIRFVADLAAADADGVEVGDAVEVTYASYADDVRLPQFRRVGAR